MSIYWIVGSHEPKVKIDTGWPLEWEPLMKSDLYPLKFKPIYKEKIWGGRRLEKLGRTLPGSPTTPIGEAWELADLSHTSVSGGGGNPERSLVANGPWAGQSLHDLLTRHGDRLLGRLQPTLTGDFPLLVKYLDASENLSVQVHPSPAYAATHPESHLKSEAWYIVAAEPGAVIYKGIQAGVTAQAFRQALMANDREALLAMMIAVPVKPGDCHYLPSGTCHALGGGILVAEVQTPSDTTFRVYDWGRQGRELHIDQALACITFGPAETAPYEKRSHIAGLHTTVSRLVTCEHFRIEKIRMGQGYEQEVPYDQPAVWMVLEGKGMLMPGNDAPSVPFATGDTLLVPAHMDQTRVKLEADTVWLEVTFPQASAESMA